MEPQRRAPNEREPTSWEKAEFTGWDDVNVASSAMAYALARAGITLERGLERRARDSDLAATSSSTSATRGYMRKHCCEAEASGWPNQASKSQHGALASKSGREAGQTS